MIKSVFVFLIAFSVFSTTFAPVAAFAQEQQFEDLQPSGPRRQMATIIFSGLAGAILGLSTLSFYGRPQDKLSNIALGFAIGIIAGASFTTYRAATRPYDYLDANLDLLEPPKPLEDPRGTMLSYSWEF